MFDIFKKKCHICGSQNENNLWACQNPECHYFKKSICPKCITEEAKAKGIPLKPMPCSGWSNDYSKGIYGTERITEKCPFCGKGIFKRV